jgi:hypothetical protein
MRAKPLAQRFWAKVNKNGRVMPGMTTPCWEWTGHRDASGYGRIHVGGSGRLAHRVAWNLVNGPVPDGKGVLHHCDNPACVRAESDPKASHTYVGTQANNMQDCARRGRHKHQRHPELARGVANGRSKLDEAAIHEIRRARASGETRAAVAARFGITPQNVTHIVTGKTWRHA